MQIPPARERNGTAPESRLPALGTPVPVNAAQLATAWQVVREALNAPLARRTVGDRENAALSTLMSALAVEFAIIVWPFCW